MIIGVPTEIKNHEYRVALVPSGVAALVSDRHRVLVQRGAGEGSGISDAEYVSAGAEIVSEAKDVYAEAAMVVKVKEPLPQEYPLLREGQVLFTFLHLAPARALTEALLDRRVVGIAYETVQLRDGSLPLLKPMSEVAGRLAVQAGAHWLEKENGGSGVLLGGVPGTPPGKVAIVGGGVVGANAAKIALGMGADVTVLDTDLERLRRLADVLDGRLTVLAANGSTVAESVAGADLAIGAVLVPGAKAAKVITSAMIGAMRSGSVVVDVAIDQGGCVEGAVPTTYTEPVLRIGGVNLFCVANLPGAVARTSTFALTNVTFPYVKTLADLGYEAAAQVDESLRKGLNVCRGAVVHRAVAEGVGLEYCPYEEIGL